MGAGKERVCWVCGGRGTVHVPEDHGGQDRQLTWSVTYVTGGGVSVAFAGDITERARFGQITHGSEPVEMDFRGVSHINTPGTMALVKLLDSLGTRRVDAVACSPAIVRQLTLLPMLSERFRVLSVMVPMTCSVCEAESFAEVDLGPEGTRVQAPTRPCPACGAASHPDEPMESYLHFRGQD